MSFSAQLNAFVTGTREKIDKTVNGATKTVLSNVIRETPVDTGAARGNWQTSVGEAKTGTVERVGADAAIAEMDAAVPAQAGSVVVMANNLPYIEKLEYGHSQQSPQGMLRTNAAKWPQIVEQEAEKHK